MPNFISAISLYNINVFKVEGIICCLNTTSLISPPKTEPRLYLVRYLNVRQLFLVAWNVINLWRLSKEGLLMGTSFFLLSYHSISQLGA